MGYTAIGDDPVTGRWAVYDPDGWQFGSHRGHPQQFYGEPFPSSDWIRSQVHDLYHYRVHRQYAQADATRQWLVDYGVIVECAKDRVRARW